MLSRGDTRHGAPDLQGVRTPSAKPELRLRVDWIKCDGFGLCGDLLPDLIDLDDWRYPVIPREAIDPARRHDVQRAVDCCPMKALKLESVVREARP